MIYDLLVGGMLSAALVPVFSDYAGRRSGMSWPALPARFLSLIAIAMAVIAIFLELFAVPVARHPRRL